MEQLILENQNLIYSITKYFERYANKEDLFQAGCIGMIMAYKNYDNSLDVKFTTYAYPYILGEMKKLVREDKSIKVSRSIQMLNLKIEKTKIILTQKLMREPSIEEISSFLELPEYMVCEAINSSKLIYSIDEPLNDEGKDITLKDTIGRVDNPYLDELIQLKDEITMLTPFEKEIIYKRYINDLTQQETADILGVSQVQVSRSEKKLLKKLKNKLNPSYIQNELAS